MLKVFSDSLAHVTRQTTIRHVLFNLLQLQNEMEQELIKCHTGWYTIRVRPELLLLVVKYHPNLTCISVVVVLFFYIAFHK